MFNARIEQLERETENGVLPYYTSADKGKILTIGDGAPQTEVVVSEQTWEQAVGTTMHDLTGADWTGIEVGDNVVVTLNGNTFNATVQGNSSRYQILYGDSNQIVYVFSSGATKSSIITSQTQTYTLSVSKYTASVEPKWEAVGLPSYTSDDNGKVLTIDEGEPKWESGGSSLPEYTSADSGKVLALGEVEGEPAIIVPEQTVTTDENGGADVPNAGLFSSLSVGDNCILIVNGDSYPVTVEYDDEEGFLYVRTTHGISIYTFAYSEEETRFAAINDGYPVGTTAFVISIVQSVTTVEPKWEGVGGYIHNASRAFESGVMGLLQTAVTTLVQNNKTFAEANGVILADDDSAAVLAMAQNPTRVNVWHALNQDFVVLRSNDNGNDNGSITVVLPYYEQVVASTLTYFLSITFTMNSNKSCYVRVFVLGKMGTSS